MTPKHSNFVDPNQFSKMFEYGTHALIFSLPLQGGASVENLLPVMLSMMTSTISHALWWYSKLPLLSVVPGIQTVPLPLAFQVRWGRNQLFGQLSENSEHWMYVPRFSFTLKEESVAQAELCWLMRRAILGKAKGLLTFQRVSFLALCLSEAS